MWEAKSDRSLVDYLSSELGSDYDGLRTLLLKMLKGDVSTAASADDAKAAEQAISPRYLPQICRKSAVNLP